MPRPRTPLPPELARTVFTSAEARSAGVTSNRLRARDVRRLGPGLYGVAEEEHVDDVPWHDLVAALCRQHPDAVAVGVTAARIWEMPLPPSIESEPEVVQLNAGTGSGRRDNELVTWHRWPMDPDEIVEREGIRVTGPARTWMDLARVVDDEWLVVLADHLLMQVDIDGEPLGEPRVRVQELRRTAHRHTTVAARLREALRHASLRSGAPELTRLRLALTRVPGPLVNSVVVGESLLWLYGIQSPEPLGADQEDVPPGCVGLAWLPDYNEQGSDRQGRDEQGGDEQGREGRAVAAESLPGARRLSGADLGPVDDIGPDTHLIWPRQRFCVQIDGLHERSSARLRRDARDSDRRRSLGWVELRTDAALIRDDVRTEARRITRALVERR